MSDVNFKKSLVIILNNGLTICTKETFEDKHKRASGYYLRILDFGHYNGYKYLIYDDDPHYKNKDVIHLYGGNDITDLIISVAKKITETQPRFIDKDMFK